MIFEDWVMLLLNIFLVFGVFTVPKVSDLIFEDTKLLQSVATTFLSVYTTLSGLFYQSGELREDKLEYLMTCLKAKQNWIPFGMSYERNTQRKDINYGQLELKKSTGLMKSDLLAKYVPFSYEFSEMTLKLLSKLISTAYLSKEKRELKEDESIEEEND